jgi:hypothetical protein
VCPEKTGSPSVVADVESARCGRADAVDDWTAERATDDVDALIDDVCDLLAGTTIEVAKLRRELRMIVERAHDTPAGDEGMSEHGEGDG